MKNLILFTLAAVVLIGGSLLTSSFTSKTKTTSTFKVWGNCGTCKKKIEGSLKVKGVMSADWNVKTKIITVVYDSTKISLDQIQKNIASVGYDNDGYKGDEKAYNKLDMCCQYERK
jgi:mercuric ion binding protein